MSQTLILNPLGGNFTTQLTFINRIIWDFYESSVKYLVSYDWKNDNMYISDLKFSNWFQNNQSINHIDHLTVSINFYYLHTIFFKRELLSYGKSAGQIKGVWKINFTNFVWNILKLSSRKVLEKWKCRCKKIEYERK